MRSLWIILALLVWSFSTHAQHTPANLVWSKKQIARQAKHMMNQYTKTQFNRVASSQEIDQLEEQLVKTMQRLDLTKLTQNQNRKKVRRQLKSLRHTTKQYGNLTNAHLVNAMYVHIY